MANLTRFEPFSDMISLRGAMDRLFDDSFVSPLGWKIWNGEGLTPPSTSTRPTMRSSSPCPCPGIKPEDVNITLTGQTLDIQGRAP